MSEPLVSVCIITYNHFKYIRSAIDGVLLQKTNFPFELIIADDYSTDGTREIILSYKEKYPGIITLILQEKNVGANKNWIDMVSAPKSKYIAFCDGDDYWTDLNKLQEQVEFLENNPDYAICYHPVEYKYEDPEPKRIFDETLIEEDTIYTADLIKNNFISTCSCVLRRDNIKEIPPWFMKTAALDWPLLLLSSFGKKIRRLNKKMSAYRVRNESIWGTKKYTYYVINTLNMFRNLKRNTPQKYLQLVNDKIFDLNIELYKSYLIDNNIIAALKTVPYIYSFGHHQNIKNYLTATQIIAVSFIRKFIKKEH